MKKTTILSMLTSFLSLILISIGAFYLFHRINFTKTIITIKADYQCPYSAKLIDGECILEKIAEKGYECPRGTQISGNTCIITTEIKQIPNCNKGKLVNNECVEEYNIPVKKVCKNKEILIDNKCYNLLSKANSCDENQLELDNKCYEMFTEDPDNKLKEIKENVYIDPNNYNELKYCNKGIYFKDKKECYELVGEALNQTLNCQNGFNIENNKCVFRSKPVMTCPKGYSFEGTSCTFWKDIPAKYTNDPTKICPNNYKLDGNKCIKKEISKPKYFCPKGYKLNGSICSKEGLK